jgi:hypothetical protein
MKQHTYSSMHAFIDSLHPPFKHHISSLHIADILGVGWNSPWTAWYNLRGGDFDPATKQQLFQNFKWLPILRRLYENHVHRSCDLQWRSIEHKEESWASGAPFGLCYDPISGTDGGVSFKLSREPALWAADGTVIQEWEKSLGPQALPANIALEAFWTMLCADLPWMDIVVAFPSWSEFVEIRVIRLLSDENIQEGLMRDISAWRERHLLQGEPPVLDDSRACTEYLVEKYRYGGEQMRIANQEESNLLNDYNSVTEQLRELQSEHRRLRNNLFDTVAYDKGLKTSEGNKAIVSRGRNGFQLRVVSPKKAS